jgi:hypothetical protein
MSSSVKAVRVDFDDDSMWVALADGRNIGVPLAWFPQLLNSSGDEREQVKAAAVCIGGALTKT